MSRLLDIFNRVADKDFELKHEFARNLMEQFSLNENLQYDDKNIEHIKQNIIEAALNKNSLEEAEIFIDDIIERVDEGLITGALKLAAAPITIPTKLAVKGAVGTAKLGKKVAVGTAKLTGKVITSGAKHIGRQIKKDVATAWKNLTKEPTIDVWQRNIKKAIAEAQSTPAFYTSDKYILADLEMVHADLSLAILNKSIRLKGNFKFYSVFGKANYAVIAVGEKNTNMNSVIKLSPSSIIICSPRNTSQKDIDMITELVKKISKNSTFGIPILNQSILTQLKQKMITANGLASFKIASTGPIAIITSPYGSITTRQPSIELDILKKREEILKNAIEGSGVKGNKDSLYDKANKSANEVWSIFLDFAKRDKFNIYSILGNFQKFRTNNRKLDYVIVTACLSSLIKNIIESNETPFEYKFDEKRNKKYKRFLYAAYRQSKWLNFKFSRKVAIKQIEKEGLQQVSDEDI